MKPILFKQKLVNIMRIRAVLLLVAVFSGLGQVAAKDISQEQLLQVMQSEKKIILLDVRTVEEFNDGHIANALNIPHKELAHRLAELSGAKNTQIVMYCRSGRRVEIATQVLKDNGFKYLDHLAGDFNGWTSNDLPVVNPK